MAKTVTVTNPVTGQPAQVDQLDHTAQQIDDAILKVKYLTGRNLLDNAYWASPDAIIDQRGGYVVPPGVSYSYSDGTGSGVTQNYVKVDSFYNGYPVITVGGKQATTGANTAVRGYTGNGYTIDRWKVTGNIVVLIQSDGLQLINTGDTTAYFSQVLEPKDAGVYCGSLLVSSVSGAVTVFLRNHDDWGYQGSIDVTGPGVFSGALTITDARKSYNQWYEIRLAAGASIKLKAAFLDLGPVQTHFHQENGNWVLNDPPPDKGIELLECIQSTADPGDGYANKVVLHTGNKPSGSYTGNGSATERKIDTGGIGNAALVFGDNVIALVCLSGAIAFNLTNPISAYISGLNFRDGALKISTDNALINYTGATYYYQVL